MDADEEGVLDLDKDVPFHHDPLDLVLLLQVLLLHRFEGEEKATLLVPDQAHLRIGPLPYHRQEAVELQRITVFFHRC